MLLCRQMVSLNRESKPVRCSIPSQTLLGLFSLETLYLDQSLLGRGYVLSFIVYTSTEL